MSRQTAAARVVDAGAVAAQAVNSYGVDSPRAYSALHVAQQIASEAQAAGCTRADLDAQLRASQED